MTTSSPPSSFLSEIPERGRNVSPMHGWETTPLALTPLPVHRPWGSDAVHQHAHLKVLEDGPLAPHGEWWLVSTRPEVDSRVASGSAKDRLLSELFAENPRAFLGDSPATPRFPLLIKYLDTATHLSVQVHPSDEQLPGEGKQESWWILSAEPGAGVFVGLRPGHSTEQFFADAESGSAPERHLQFREVKSGDCVHLPPGTIHALGAGVVALEVQQNADTTYRIYDWNREPARPLHLAEARDVVAQDQTPQFPEPTAMAGGQGIRLVSCSDYRVEKWSLEQARSFNANGQGFHVLVPFDGPVRVRTKDGEATAERGNPILVPAGVAEYTVDPEGPVRLIRVLSAPAN